MAQIRCLEDISQLPSGARVLCLFSGGLDGAFMLAHAARHKSLTVTGLTVGLGGGADVDRIQSTAQKLGCQSIIIDQTERFLTEFVGPAIFGHATYLGGHPICASLSRPLIARSACEFAAQHDCNVILHSSNRSQNSLRRFNTAFRDLGFDGIFGSPFESSSVDRQQKIEFLRHVGLSEYEARTYSSDTNVWGREVEYGPLDDPENIDLDSAPFLWTAEPATTLSPVKVSIGFERGLPSHFDSIPIDLKSLIQRLNSLAGSYGIGRFVGLEEIGSGVKVQEIREMPAALVLLDVYRRLESAVVSAETIRVKMDLEQLWVREAVEGRWFGNVRPAAQAFLREIANSVSGQVTYELRPNDLRLLSLKASKPLYIRDRAIFEGSTDSFKGP